MHRACKMHTQLLLDCFQVVSVGMEDTLDMVTPLFELYTGIPVVDEDNKCVGIISNIDVARYARGKAQSLPTTRVK